jgi:arylsulfatase A-like enzyme
MRLSRREILAAPLLPLARAAEAAPPNIVFLMADDLGYADLSCYGRRDYTTPNVDALARGGVRFTQAYANSAVCSATRTALITGRYQYRLPIGLEEPLAAQSTRKVGLPPEHPTLPSLLRKAGYTTALIGKWHMGFLPDYSPLRSGYDHFWGFRSGAIDYFSHKGDVDGPEGGDLWDGDTPIHQAGYLTNLLGDHAVAFVSEAAKVRRPFFLSLHFNAPHWPWEGPEDEAESRRISALGDYDGGDLATYARMVRQMDAQVGRVLQALDDGGAAANTIVVFTSDNGGERFSDTWPFSGRKGELLEGGLRIPAIARWPGHIRPGSVTTQVGMSMDWLPTLLAAAGARPDPAYPSDGVNLLPVLTGASAPVPRKVFWRFRSNAQRAVRDGDLKWLEINENTFLFDVVKDPLERANLKNRQPDVHRRLAAEFEEWNRGMLPEDPAAFSAKPNPALIPDRYGSRGQ